MTGALDPTGDTIQRAAWALRMERVAVETVALFAGLGIDSIVLKGPSFARLFYPEGGRSYGDVDVLVRESDFPRARDALLGVGFRDIREGWSADDYTGGTARTYRRRSGGSKLPETIDLHWSLHRIDVEPTVAWRVLSRHTTDLALGAGSITVLDAVGCALHVGLHAAQHGLLGPEPEDHGCMTGEDLSRAVALLDDATWRRAAELARELRAEPAFAFGMRLDAGGGVVAERVGLTTELPTAGSFPGRSFALHGERTFLRVLEAGGVRARLAVLRPFLLPSPGRRAAWVRTAPGRRVVFVGYLEYWLRVAPGVIPALRAARHDQRARRDRS